MFGMSPLRTVPVFLFFVTVLMSTSGLAVEDDGTSKLLTEARATARRGSYPEALEKLEEALELARENDNSLIQAITLDNMAEVHRLQKNTREARNRYTQALKIYQDINHRLGVQATQRKLAALSDQRPSTVEPPPPPEPVDAAAHEPGLPPQTRGKLINNAIDRIRNRVKGQEANKGTEETAAIPQDPVIEPQDNLGSAQDTKDTKDTEKSAAYSTYLQTVKDSIVRAWEYPERASEGKEQGKVDVEFTIQKNGNLQNVQILRSSGFSDLDREAIRAVSAASPFNPIPDQIELDQLSIRFTFNYTLETSQNSR
jgi:protein TonB